MSWSQPTRADGFSPRRRGRLPGLALALRVPVHGLSSPVLSSVSVPAKARPSALIAMAKSPPPPAPSSHTPERVGGSLPSDRQSSNLICPSLPPQEPYSNIAIDSSNSSADRSSASFQVEPSQSSGSGSSGGWLGASNELGVDAIASVYCCAASAVSPALSASAAASFARRAYLSDGSTAAFAASSAASAEAIASSNDAHGAMYDSTMPRCGHSIAP
mmetsp:Transcript_26377/g.56912  ORF Transcript_26377/g.56912 Transcript_26377/m.56912 type:complete len:217 (-) Transcript_26377:265-915(-)